MRWFWDGNGIRAVGYGALLLALLIFGSASLYALLRSDDLARFLFRQERGVALALALTRNDADLAFEIGNYFFSEKAHDTVLAASAYRKAQSIDPALLGPRYQLARIEFLDGDLRSALALIDDELRLHPSFVRSHYVRGLIRGYIRDFRGAEEDFLLFLRWDPISWAAHNDLAWVYFQEGRFVEAERTAREGLKRNPGNAWLLTSWGAALLNLGERERALRAFLEAQEAARLLTPQAWGRAYPGNDPRLYEEGLEALRLVVATNIGLARGAESQ